MQDSAHLPTKATINISDLKNSIAQTLVTALQSLLQGPQADIQQFAANMIEEAATAALSNDSETLAELADQQQTLLEINRLELAAEAQTVFTNIVTATISFVEQVLSKAILAA